MSGKRQCRLEFCTFQRAACQLHPRKRLERNRSPTVAPINRRDVVAVRRPDHPASHLLSWTGIERIVFPFTVVRSVAILTGHPQSSGEDAHRAHEFIYGNSFEHLHILEDVLCHLWTLGEGGKSSHKKAQKDLLCPLCLGVAIG